MENNSYSIKHTEIILPDTSMNLWYHWTGMTESGSSSRNLFRAAAIVEKSYPDKSAPITSAKETNTQLWQWNCNSSCNSTPLRQQLSRVTSPYKMVFHPYFVKEDNPQNIPFAEEAKTNNRSSRNLPLYCK
jgi:hypothetical protein